MPFCLRRAQQPGEICISCYRQYLLKQKYIKN